MKNQYFGDINDYWKYGLLRVLSGGKKGSAAVCWMLTPDVRGKDSKQIGYLRNPRKWDRFDHNLFYSLQEAVIIYGDRSLARAESEHVLSPATFSYYRRELPGDLGKRREYFQQFFEASGKDNRDLVFFDPDKGLCTEQNPLARVRSVERLYFDELEDGFKSGFSVLVIQFLPFAKRSEFVKKTVCDMFRRLRVGSVACFQTQRVVFFLIPQPQHLAMLRQRSERVSDVWHPEIRVVWQTPETGQGLGQSTPSEA